MSVPNKAGWWWRIWGSDYEHATPTEVYWHMGPDFTGWAFDTGDGSESVSGYRWDGPVERANLDAIRIRHALANIAESGFMSAKLSAPEELVATMDWMVNTAQAALAGEELPEMAGEDYR